MKLTVSPPIRLLAVVALAALAVLMGGLYFVTRAQLASQNQTAPTPVVHPTPPSATSTPAQAKAKVTPAKHAKAGTAKTSTAPAVKKTAARPDRIAIRLAASHRMPLSIAEALQHHRVVVAALVVPDARLDTTVLAEARAGAERAGVGFVAIDVLGQRAGRALAEKLGVVETPAVVVYRRPATVFLKLEGFADRDMVSQAVANAFGR